MIYEDILRKNWERMR